MASFYSKSVEDVLKELATNKTGLTSSEAEIRLSKYGENKLTAKNKISALGIFIEQFKNTLTLILLASTLLILFIYFFGDHDQSDLIEAGLIFGIVILIAVLGFFQEYKAEKAVESLKKLLAFNAKVKRDGRTSEIDVTKLVAGDIVILEEGMRVPADIRLIESYQLRTAEASLTGESTTIGKTTETLGANLQIGDQKNMIFSGTNIVSGRGLGVVVATGNNTEIGKIATTVASTGDEATPMQLQLEGIGKKIGYIVVGICAVVFLFIVFFANEFSSLPLIEKLIHSFIASVALAVAAIPEGLPAVVTISLALGTQRMLARHALVKKLNSVETLGATDVICSDKTGTLTKGEMTTVEIFADGKNYEITGTGYDTAGEFRLNQASVDPQALSLLLEIGCECNNASIDNGKVLGDPTEAALIVAAQKANINRRLNRLFEVPFTSERKMMSVVVERDNKYFVYTKGAPEILLDHTDLAESEKKQVLAAVDKMSLSALRTLGFAYKEISKEDLERAKTNPEVLESKLIFSGIQGLIDPPRKEIRSLIESCKSSGIRVIMITGDHKDTAHAVAKEIGIEGDAITGYELDSLNDEQLAEVVRTKNIYARVNPGVKMKIVECLKKDGHIVAMTGDGVNDAPALKRADIGIAMGITGTDVAKESSDVILLDDHFETIVKAIEEGRGIYNNIKKFVHYLLACNLAEVATVFLAIILFRDIPLSATMLLWINVVTDGLPAVALGLDPAKKEILKDKPSDFQGAIIDKRVWLDMGIFAILLALFVIVIYYINLPEGMMEAKGAAFMSIVVFEMIKLFIVRKIYKTSFFTNPLFYLAVISTFILQLIIMYVPFAAKLFEIGHIDLHDWLLVGGMGIVLWFSFFLISKTIRQVVRV